MKSKISIQDLIRWCIYALVVFVPAVYHTGFDSAFTLPKLTLIRVVTLIIIGLWGVQIFAQGHVRVRRSPLNKWLIGYGLVSALTTLFSTYFWVSFFGDQGRFIGLMTWVNLLFLIFVVITFFQNKRDIQTYLRLSVWTAIILSIYGLLQFKGIVGAEGWDHDPTLRIFGTLGHSNHFGAYITFHIMLLVGMWFNARTVSRKWLYGIAVLPMVTTIFATASRGAFFSLVAAVFVFTCAIAFQHRKWIHKKRKQWITVFVIAIVAIGIFNKPLINRFENLSLTQRTVSTMQFIKEGNVPDRVSWWYSALAMTRDNPVFGHGLSTFRDVYNSYRRTDYRVPGDIQDTFSPETAHMEYLHIAATQGLAGLFFYLGLIFCWASFLFKVMRDPDVGGAKKITALSLFSAGIVYLVQVLMSFGVIGTLLPFVLMIGVSASLYHMESDPLPQSKQFKTLHLVRGRKAAFVLVVLTFVAFSAWFTLRQAKAEFQLRQGDIAKSQGEVALMLDHYKEATHTMPWMYEYWQRLGEGAFYFGTYDNDDLDILEILIETSVDAYEQAYKRMRTMPSIQGNLALSITVYADILEAKGQTVGLEELRERSLELYREAIDVAVNNPIFPYTYGKLLRSHNRLDEARNTFLYVLELRDPYQDTYTQLATIETDQKNYEQARTYIQQGLRVTPGDENLKAIQQRVNGESSS
jgi:hypothetical protein